MKKQFDWKLPVLAGVAFLVLYPIERLMFGTESLFSGSLGAGLTGAISVGIALVVCRLLFAQQNSN
jgi:hypothetical protein